MKKLTILFAALTLSVGLWAIDGVKYIDANGQEQTANGVTEITNASSTLAAGWYVVKGNEVTTGSLTCSGAVHLILADGAKLTATAGNEVPGIQVSGDGNSLTIYGQSTGDQMGQLFATGGKGGAGIGGGWKGNGTDITINGGTVMATGVNGAAGIGGGYEGSGSNITINGGQLIATGGLHGAGIGGGGNGTGSNITINGGTVMATGGDYAAGIGGGYPGSGSNIKVSTNLLVRAGSINPPAIVIINNGTDLANSLAGKLCVLIEDDSVYKAAKAAAKAELLGAMGEECTDCHAVEVTKGDKTITLYAPDKVKYIKVE